MWTGYKFTGKYSTNYPTCKVLPLGTNQIYAGKLANSLGTFKHISVDGTSCISGHSALEYAKLLIESGKLTRVVIVAVDNGTSEEFMKFFAENKLITLDEERKFFLGQGVNITVIEDAVTALGAGRAVLHAVTTTAEAIGNPLGISEQGTGYSNAIQDALAQAGVVPQDIRFVKLHNTHSLDNCVELSVVKKLFGNIETISYKQDIGHTLGASTAIETDLAIRDNGPGMFLSLGAGMGNVFSAAILEIL
jgi:3-oxoacyl-(acyl-carrier-protein) synthase